MPKSRSGFTIVELLIVIVVIAILAAISIVAYTGIQQRATNTKIIAAANQTIKSVTAYIAANGTYPVATTVTYCLVPDESASCASFNAARSSNTPLLNSLATISTLPVPTPYISADWTGIVYEYNSSLTFNGAPQPLRITYALRGVQQQCGLANISNTGGTAMASSGVGYTASVSDPGYTICIVSIPGPAS